MGKTYNKATKARYQRDLYRRRKEQIASGELEYEAIPHGTNGYTNYGCRCEVCRAANSEAQAEDRANRQKRAREHPEEIPHGTVNGYTNYRCRCGPCTAANTDGRRQRRELLAVRQGGEANPLTECPRCRRKLMIRKACLPRHNTPAGERCAGSNKRPEHV